MFIARSPIVNNRKGGSGNMPPEKNMRIKNGKQPIVNRSNIVRKYAATMRLMAIIDKHERRPTIDTATNEPDVR